MDNQFDLEKTVHRLLTPQEVLAPWLFDENNIMKEDVRRGLLKIADYVIEKTIKDTKGLEVYDICLTGSSCNYMYHKDSDIDLRIEIHNKNCKELSKSETDFENFLSAQGVGALHNGHTIKYQGRFVDIKLSCKEIDFTSLYSIQDNKWLIFPKKDFGIKEDEMIAYYQKRRQEIMKELEKIKNKYEGMKLGKKLKDFYSKTILRSIKGKPTIKDYLVFKLLHYEKLLKPIGAGSIMAYNKALTLRKENTKVTDFS